MASKCVGIAIGGNTYKSSRKSMKSCRPNFHYKLYMNQDKTKKEKVRREGCIAIPTTKPLMRIFASA